MGGGNEDAVEVGVEGEGVVKGVGNIMGGGEEEGVG